MSNYRRSRTGGIFFFTVVTDRRQPILTTNLGRQCLRTAMKEVQAELPFGITAIVLLPNHLHTVWTLPQEDTDYSTRWRRIKTTFTKAWTKGGGKTQPRSKSRIDKGEQGVWQRRFFEHTCQDERDMQRCVDYIHVNPLKHQLVERVRDWPWSSFHRYVKEGHYDPDWGSANEWYGDEFVNFE